MPSSRVRAGRVSAGRSGPLLVGAVMVLGLGGLSGEPSIVEREAARRATLAREAEVLLEAGDKAYEEGRYGEAVRAFSEAREGLSTGFRTAALRAAATERLAQASVERARQLARNGQIAEAGELLDKVLAAEVAPHYGPALQMREQIADPLRYNPAVTPAHVAAVDEVRRLLYEAEGFRNLGQYDRARTVYEAILQLDPYNTASRRGMEELAGLRSEYARAAYDETRAGLLAEVDAAWESQVPPPRFGPGEVGGPGGGAGATGPTVAEKLASMIVPVVDLDQAGLDEAVDFLRQQSIALDTLEPDLERRGISFVVELGDADPEGTRDILDRRFNLKLHNVPMGKVLEYITEATRTRARLDQFAVVIWPRGVVGEDIVTRTWRVPPDFLSREELPAGGGEADPFGEDEGPGLLAPRLTAEEFLKSNGVSFPEGAGVVFSPANSTLTARNTPQNLDLIDQVVQSITNTEPLAVVVEVRLVTTTRNRLEELGFDWTSGNHQLANSQLFLGGGTVGSGTPITDVPPGQSNPVTAGLRSGNGASATNTIDAAIDRQFQTAAAGSVAGTSLGGGALASFLPPTPDTDPTNNRAPGILTLIGVFNEQAVTVMMRGVDQLKGIDLMTKKSVVTRPGQTAYIESVQEFIYPTEYEPPEVPNQAGGGFFDPLTGQFAGGGAAIATPAMPTAFETTKLGCMLEVVPQVGADRRTVEVALRPVIRRFDGFVNYGSPITGGSSSFLVDPGGLGNGGAAGFLGGGSFGQVTANNILMPVISTIRSESNLTIYDGETVVMGGMHASSINMIEDKVPVLGSLPWVGRFFQSEVASFREDALIILVTVRLQDPSGRAIRSP